MNARTIALTAAAALSLGLALSACGPTVPAEPGAQPANTAAAPATPLATPAAEDEPADDPAPADDTAKVQTWGQGITYKDGLAVTLTQPTGYAPTEYAAGTEGFTSFVVFNVTVTNGTAAPFDPTMVSVAGTSGGVAIGSVFDSGNANPTGLAPSASILPGQSVTWPLAFGVANTADITLDVTPGYTPDYTAYAEAFWQGAAA